VERSGFLMYRRILGSLLVGSVTEKTTLTRYDAGEVVNAVTPTFSML